MKRTALRLVPALLICLLSVLAGPAEASNQRKVAFGLQGPFDCTLCHGNETNGQYWPDGLGGLPGYVDDSAGSAASHDGHVLAIGQYLGYGDYTSDQTGSPWTSMYTDVQQLAICAFCHFDPGGGGHLSNTASSPAGQADVIGDGFSAGTFTAFDVASQATKLDANNLAAYDPVAKTCANVDCHYETTTPTYAASGWDSGNTGAPDCETCHFYRDGGTYPQNAYVSGELPDAHQVHVAGVAPPSSSQSKGYPCAYCHNVTGYTTAHLSGAIDLDVSATPNANADESVVQLDLAVKYGAGVAPDDADATCSGLYCHGADFSGAADGTGGTRGTDITPVWSDHTTGTCGDCHDIDVDGVGSQPFDQGAHTIHVPLAAGGVQYGPGLSSHYFDCAVCHGFKDPQGGGFCSVCHTPPGLMPGGAEDEGREWAPSASHVEGNFEVDFAGQDRGWNDMSDSFTAVGTLAPLGTAHDNGTDICNRCHSTAPVNGAVGGTEAKLGWTAGARLDCETCHNDTSGAFSKPVSGGIQAPGKDTNFATRGHGLPATSTYPWSPGRDGAGATCADCHDDTAAHVSAVAGDTDRLSTSGNALCNGCHDGPGTGSAITQVTTHANTSQTLLLTYTPQRPQFELNCIECHDVHGSPNIYMVSEDNPDGPLVAPRIYNDTTDEFTSFLFNGTVAFTANGVGSDYASTAADATKICQTCHTVTGNGDPSGPIYQFNNGTTAHATAKCSNCHRVHDFDDNFAATSQDAFMTTCNGCHGFPPVKPGEEGSDPDLVVENYLGGGGAHKKHILFLKSKLADSRDVFEICGPCHGDTAGMANHADSNEVAGSWPIAARAFVDIRARADDSWDGMPADPAPGNYGGSPLPTNPPGNAADPTDSTCSGVDCHGNPVATEGLYWAVDTTDTPGAGSGSDATDGLGKSQACAGCHDDTLAEIRVYDAAGSSVYTAAAAGATASYYGTVSGYSRGGHGDAEIQNEDPFVDSAPGINMETPIDCTACHVEAPDNHFPAAAGDIHRLGGATIESASHGSSEVCNQCHAGVDYPGDHHPSYRGPVGDPPVTKDIVPAAGQEVYTVPSSWSEVPPPTGHYEQDGYEASAVSGDTDYYVDWWNNTPPADAPTPAPFATLPLERYILGSGTSNITMCVTCHNPHGTDLFVFDPGAIGAEIPDNNMLRLRDSDNTLCNACH